MGKYVLGGFLSIVFIILALFTFSFQRTTVADNDNQSAMNNAASQAMTEAMNLGYMRVNGVVTIDEDVAKDAFVRMYASSSDFDDGGRYINVYEVNSDPAYIAVDAYTEIYNPFQKFTNIFLKEKREIEPQITRSREVVIYEAIETTR